MALVLAPILWPLSGVLGLLLYWRRHQHQVLAGVINPVDLWNPSGIQWSLYVVPDQSEACPVCREMHGTVCLGRNFSSLSRPCSTPDTCMGLVVHFSGGWLWSNDLIASLNTTKLRQRRLSPQELTRLLKQEWDDALPTQDRIGLHLVSGYQLEGNLPVQAIRSYGAIIKEAELPRDQRTLMAAYLRLTGSLARHGTPQKALQVIAHFEKKVARAAPGAFTPSGKQRRALLTMKPYLYSLVDHQAEAVPKPARLDETSQNGWRQG